MIQIPEKYTTIVEESKGGIGLLGISVGKQYFTKKEIMKEYISFMSKQFEKSTILIADWPKRFNLQAIENKPLEEAEQSCIQQGDNLEKFLKKLIKKTDNVEIKRWKEILNSEYETVFYKVEDAFKNETEFQKDCIEITQEFLLIKNNKNKWTQHSNLEQTTNIAVNYLLEEIAELIAIPNQIKGKYAEIYPGTNKVWDKIRSKEYNFLRQITMNPQAMFFEAHYLK